MPTHEIQAMIGGASLRRALVALWCLVAAGCAAVTAEQTHTTIAAAAPAAAATAPPAAATAPPTAATAPPTAATGPSVADDAAMPEVPSVPPVAGLTGSTVHPIEQPPMAVEPIRPEPAPPSVSNTTIAAPAELAVTAPVVPAAEELATAPSLVPSSVAPPTAAETLDFSSLVARLRKTKAISLRTKVAVKHESDDLLQQFRAYHTQHEGVTLTDLRSAYDSLFHKLHSLLQETDPPLARDIDRSRSAIWEFLADPSKFGASHLMAGA